MQKPLSIRPAEKKDLSDIGSIADATGLFPSDLLEPMIAGYFDRSKRDLWFVCELGDGAEHEVVGFGFCEPERMTDGTWNLLAIGVEPSHQGQGAGGAMLRYLEDQLRQLNVRVLLVETMGTPEFELTRTFYRQNDYTEEARIREFYEAGADKIVFWKHLQKS